MFIVHAPDAVHEVNESHPVQLPEPPPPVKYPLQDLTPQLVGVYVHVPFDVVHVGSHVVVDEVF